MRWQLFQILPKILIDTYKKHQLFTWIINNWYMATTIGLRGLSPSHKTGTHCSGLLCCNHAPNSGISSIFWARFLKAGNLQNTIRQVCFHLTQINGWDMKITLLILNVLITTKRLLEAVTAQAKSQNTTWRGATANTYYTRIIEFSQIISMFSIPKEVK